MPDSSGDVRLVRVNRPIVPSWSIVPDPASEGATDMTPWLRLLRATGLAVALLGASAVVSPYGPAVAYASVLPYDDRSAPDAVAARASAEPSRAGSRAGEGRERPGREDPPEEQDGDAHAGDGEDADARAEHDHDGDGEARAERDRGGDGDAPAEEDGGGVTAVPEESREAAPVPSAPSHHAVRQPSHAERPVGPVLRILPLGSGLVLIGLGLGLAFVALRLRRV